MNNKKIAVLQPEIPHYRTEFFERLRSQVGSLTLFTYNKVEAARKGGFSIGLPSEHIATITKGGFAAYNPLPLLSHRYDTLVLMLHQGHLTTWLLLLTKWIHRKKIILWGQGISVKRYLKEEHQPNPLLKWQLAMADGAWIYMEREADMWRKRFPKKPIVALHNSVTGISAMLDYKPADSVAALKEKYGIHEQEVFIFCARFGSPFRRVDLLVDIIKRLDANRFGFVIIGDGKGKPDFAPYANVHDFGAVYDDGVKRELFSLSDMYLQPGWIGLSVVEAMAYGLPVCTFRRRGDEIRHGVEYGLLTDGENAVLADNVDELVERVEQLPHETIEQLGQNARRFIRENNTPEIMVENAMKIM